MSSFDRRQFNLGLFSAGSFGLLGGGVAGCTGGAAGPELATQDPSSIAAAENVELGPGDLPDIKTLMQAGPLGDKALGSKNAPVTMIKYASLTCPSCRRFQLGTYPALKKRYIDKGKVRFILREFPIGRASGTATLIMRCAGQKSTARYFDLYNRFITKQKLWVSQDINKEGMFKVASGAGVSRAEFNACLKNEEMIHGLKWVKQRARKMKVSSTPTFFINGKKERGVLSIEQIQGMIAPYLS